MIKEEASNYFNQHFSSLSKKEKINLDTKILKNFKKILNILNCKNIGSYVSLNNEVSTFNLNQFISEKGINVFLPKLSKNKKNKHLRILH
jgi:5-formyltetrahydrofolate cyclo-ligase